MILSTLLIVLASFILAMLAWRFVWRRVRRHHDPIEYYRGWGGYRHPIGLQDRIGQEETEALGAEGAVYLVAAFDGDSRLMHVTKFYRGEIFFEYVYAYHPNGRLKSATITRGGRVTVLELDARGRRVSEARSAF